MHCDIGNMSTLCVIVVICKRKFEKRVKKHISKCHFTIFKVSSPTFKLLLNMCAPQTQVP